MDRQLWSPLAHLMPLPMSWPGFHLRPSPSQAQAQPPLEQHFPIPGPAQCLPSIPSLKHSWRPRPCLSPPICELMGQHRAHAVPGCAPKHPLEGFTSSYEHREQGQMAVPQRAQPSGSSRLGLPPASQRPPWRFLAESRAQLIPQSLWPSPKTHSHLSHVLSLTHTPSTHSLFLLTWLSEDPLDPAMNKQATPSLQSCLSSLNLPGPGVPQMELAAVLWRGGEDILFGYPTACSFRTIAHCPSPNIQLLISKENKRHDLFLLPWYSNTCNHNKNTRRRRKKENGVTLVKLLNY